MSRYTVVFCSLPDGLIVSVVVTPLTLCLLSLSCSAQEFLTHEGYFVPDSNGYPVGSEIGRGDVARFMLSLLNSNAWVKKGVAIITK